MWRREAISGTTPPKGACTSAWEARDWARTVPGARTRATAVSSQDDSMPNTTGCKEAAMNPPL